MFARHPLVIGTLLLFMNGCAYSSAMGRGARSEQAREWESALTAYDKALSKKPDEEEALVARKRALESLVDQAIRDTNDALIAGQFELAMENLAIVPKYDGDRPEVYVLQQKAQEQMAGRYTALFAKPDKGDAYAMAVRTRKLFPSSGHLDAAFAELRAHYMITAGGAAAEHHYPAALATLRTILEYEPDQAPDIAEQERGIIDAWGEHLAGKAAKAAARKPGAAAAWYARAYEVAAHPEHLDKARAISSRLQSAGPLTVSLSVTGDRRRTKAMKEGVLASLTALPDTLVVTRSAKLDFRVQVDASRCRETDQVTPSSKDYVSGKEEHPNPEWQRLTQEIAVQRQNADLAGTNAAGLQADFFVAEQALKGIDSQLEIVHRDLATATQSVNEANTQVQTQTQYYHQLQANLAAQEGAGAFDVANQVRAQLNQVGGTIAQWNGELQRRQQYAGQAQQRVQQLTDARALAVGTAMNAKATYDGAVLQQQAAHNSAEQLSATLAGTPKMVWRDVHTLHEYDVHEWTRTCEAPVRVTLRPKWDSRMETTATYAPAHQTQDRSYRGHSKSALEEDPKAFPDSDAALTERGDATTLIELATLIEKVAEDHFAVRRSETTLALTTEPEGSTTELVELLVGARNRLDEATLTTFRSHLKSIYGLEDIELLTPLPGR